MKKDLVQVVLDGLAQSGVEEIILCAGARNATFVQRLGSARGVRTYAFFEERSAGFFAIGRMQATGRPVAVITTSGTAASELLSPIVEADHQGLPFIAVTCDRPRSFRGSGAPQSIRQTGLYTNFIEREWDFEAGDPGLEAFDFSWSGRRPVHLNICLNEPKGERVDEWAWPSGAFQRQPLISDLGIQSRPEIINPLVLVGGLNPVDASAVFDQIESWGVPVYAEGVSQLRGRFTREITDPGSVAANAIIRVGSVPTHRYWRDLEHSTIPVYHFARQTQRGLSRSGQVWPLEGLVSLQVRSDSSTTFSGRESLEKDLDRFPLSEPSWVRWLSRQMVSHARVFLGNSLPIREWDLAADPTFSGVIGANRGANGIDGLVSSAIGAADESGSNWAVLGDLSTLYDLSGPWALRERPLKDFNLVVLNNGGGKIFDRLLGDPRLENRHALNFAHWAAMWDLEYVRLASPAPLPPAKKPRVIEIIPDVGQTHAFWDARGGSK